MPTFFSLGAVLYEMWTGNRAFRGKTHLSVASAIMEGEFLPLGFRIPTIQGSEPVRFVHLSPGGVLLRRPSTQSGKDWQCQSTVEPAPATRGSGKDLYPETL